MNLSNIMLINCKCTWTIVVKIIAYSNNMTFVYLIDNILKNQTLPITLINYLKYQIRREVFNI